MAERETKPRRQRRTPGGATERINLRVTPETKAGLAERAGQAGLSLPNFLLTSARDCQVGTWSPVVHDELDFLHRQLAQVGNNLNQIAASVHSTGTAPAPQLQAALGLLTKLLERLDCALDEAGVR